MVKKGEIEEEEVVMDTPVRSKTTQITKFEESPVFNFLNSLSPIRPVKSLHISQTINSLNFTSIASIFTSPHVSTTKESRFLRRHQLGDPSKPEFSSGYVSKDDNTERKAEAELENKEAITPEGPIEVSDESPYENSQTLNYNFGSPNFNQMIPCDLRSKLESEIDGSSRALVPYVQGGGGSMLHEVEVCMEGLSRIDQTKEGGECELDSLISDTADLLNFDSPNDAKISKNVVDDETRFYPLTSNDMDSSQGIVGQSAQLGESKDPEDQFAQPGDRSELNEFTGNPTISGVCSQSTDAIDGGLSFVHETTSNLSRGMRRRCLVFELSGARKNHLPENLNSESPTLPQFDGNCMIMDKQTIPTKFTSASSHCILPSIGLHLNALAATSKEYKVVKNDSCTSGKQLVITPTSNYLPLNSGQDSLSKAVGVTQSDGQIVLFENGHSSLEDDGHVSDCIINDESNQTSPKKKRRRSDNGEDGSCKRCNCKKSKCLKMYCECFAAGLYCMEPCSCIDCFNKPSHVDTVLATRKQIESRNPLAFAPKVIRTSDPLSEATNDSNKTPASARHKRGCNCKKSGCMKKYCECYQGGVGCSINCRCEGCKNAFGRKDGSEIVLEVDVTQETVIDGTRRRSLIQGNSEHILDCVNAATPVSFGRPTHHLQFPSKDKPPHSTFLHVGSSSAVCPSQAFARPDVNPPPSKFDNNVGLLKEGDIPMVLQKNGFPISSVKSLSPNGKRVSPPHSIRNTSPSRRSSRKLILQSIPSFPSLTPKNHGHVSNEPESVPVTELH